MRLDTALEGFWLSRRRNLSPNTQRDYDLTFRRLTDHLGPGADFTKITGADLNDFLNTLETDLGLGKKTLKNHWIALSALWTWAETEIGAIHIVQLHLEPPSAKRPTIVPFTLEEIKLMLAGCDFMTNWDTGASQRTTARRPTATRDKAILMTLLDGGLRATELTDLRLRDYDTRRGQIIIRHGKGDKQRTIYLGETARKYLWRYLTKDRAGAKLDDPLFLSREGGPLDRHAIRLLIHRIGDRVGVRNAHPHRFRHTFAINFLRNGGNLFALQAALGHSNLETVKLYAKLAETDLEAASKHASVADRWNL